MCGRFVGSFSVADLLDEIASEAAAAAIGLPGIDRGTVLLENFNVAPTTDIPAISVGDGQLEIFSARWGLIPSWATKVKSGQPLVNARSETVHEKPSFRGLLGKNRCIVPMSGFYEWDRTDPRAKKPYYVPRQDGHLMLCLGLFSRPKILDGRASVAILTTNSHDDLAPIHDRAPVQVDAATAVMWLADDENPLSCVAGPMPRLAPYPVSPAVNSVRNNSSDLISPVRENASSDGPLFG
jgi:putative SOS response-associated peptidase YedK